MATDTLDPEGAVRRYLLYVDDPSKLRDESDIQRKTQAVLDAADPIEKVKAIADLKRAANVDEQPLRAGFVEHAKAWADEQGIPVSAFQEMKVGADVLREAGFEVAAPTGRRRGGGGGSAPASGGESRQRAKSVPVDQIKAWVLDQKGTFVLTDVQQGVGGSPATVRKAVEELVESGEVERIGPMADCQGRGRAPVQYARS